MRSPLKTRYQSNMPSCVLNSREYRSLYANPAIAEEVTIIQEIVVALYVPKLECAGEPQDVTI
jgi:hypothetical protein